MAGYVCSICNDSISGAGPQAGTTGSLLLNFGGINLGSQNLPAVLSSNPEANQSARQGNGGSPTGNNPLSLNPLSSLTGVGSASNSSALFLIAGLGLVLWYFLKHKA
jgi:hypothetical protein